MANYDEVTPFVDLIEEVDGIVFGSPTLNGDAVKPIWDLLSSLAVISVKDKLGATFGSYGWTGEAVSMLEDRLRGLKPRAPVTGARLKLISTEEELEQCSEFGKNLGRQLGEHLTGRNVRRVIAMEELAGADPVRNGVPQSVQSRTRSAPTSPHPPDIPEHPHAQG